MEYLLLPFQQPVLLLLIAVGVFVGIYVAAIPGLTGTMAVSLLVSFTYGWNVNAAIALMIGIFNGASYGGSRSAILLNIPGAPAAVATALDGYPLAQKGEAGKAMGVSTIQSVFGGLIGTVALVLCAPLISKFALKFAARDYLLLAFMGLMLVGSLGNRSIAKGIFSAALGVLLGCVGMDVMTGLQRFTFGNTYLMPGINSVVAMLGLFGASEAILQIRTKDLPIIKQKVDKIIPNLETVKKHLRLTIQSSFIGVLIGALPGAGGSIAALIAYDQAKRTVKKPEVPFGEGAIEGLVAPESANNAAVGGALIPMLTLGIPGDAVTAVILGALFIHGLQPGPTLMATTPGLFYLICICLGISNIFLLVFGLTGIKITTKLVEIPRGRLVPMIIVLSVIGSYALNKNLYDVFWMGGFGILAYIMKRYDYPIAPAVLGIILSSMIEKNYKMVVILAETNPAGFMGTFVAGLFTSPISLVLLFIIIFSFVVQSRWYKEWQNKRDKKRQM